MILHSLEHRTVKWPVALGVPAGGALSAGAAYAISASNLPLLAVTLGAIGLAVAFMWPRVGVYMVFGLVLFEGVGRNLLDSPNVLLAKDLLLAGVYLRIVGQRVMDGERAIPRTPINLALILFAAVTVIECFNPNVESPLQAVIGLRTWLYYVPLYYVANQLFTEERHRRRFLIVFVAAAVPVCASAIVEAAIGPHAYAGLGPAFAQSTFVAGLETGTSAIYRPNATFSFPSHFGIYLASLTFILLALVLRSRGRKQFAGMMLLGVAVAVTVLENQRSLLLLTPLALGFVVVRIGRARQALIVAVAGALGAGLMVAAASFLQSSAVLRVTSLVTNQGSIFNTRGSNYFDQVIQTLALAPFGLGAGATAIGSRYVGTHIPLFVELSLAKVIGDLGILGLLSYVFLFAVLIRTTVRTATRAQAKGQWSLATLAMCVAGYQLLVLFTGYDLAVAATTLWFLSGMVARDGLTPGHPGEVGRR